MKPRDGAATAAPALSYSQHKNYLLSYLYGVKPPRPLFHFHSVSLSSHFPLLPITSIHSSIWPFPLHLSFVTLPSHTLPSHLSRSSVSPLTLFPLTFPNLLSPPPSYPPPVDGPGIWELVGPGFYRPDMVETCGGRGASEGYAFPTFGPMLTTVWSSAAWVPGISILPMAFS